MKRATLAAVCLLAALVPADGATAQELGPDPLKAYALLGGRIHTLAGQVIESGTVVIREGRIAAVDAGIAVPADAEVIDVSGLEIYPGLFDSYSRLGLTEVGAVSATVDTSEAGDFNPHLLAAAAIHPASEHIPVARANGITHAVSAPGAGGFGGGGALLGGQASLIHLDGWTIEEMLVRPSVGLVVNWPTLRTRTFDLATFSEREQPFTEVKKEYDEKIGELEEWLEAARHYAQAAEKGSAEKFTRRQKLEALAPVVRGASAVLVAANSERDIRNAVEFCAKQGLKMILAGGAEAWKVKELLKEKDIPVILRPTQSLPSEEDDPYDKAYSNPGELRAAGVRIAFATFDSSDSRTLPYEAGNAVAFGLPHEEALKAITLYPAQILGVGDLLGSIEVGKLANLIVTDGDPLEITTQVRQVFIKGVPVSTDNRHKQLYEKYRARP